MAGRLRSILHPAHLRRTGAIALVVGSWLTLFNQGDAILAGDAGAGLWVKVTLNYLTPFVVANLGLVSRKLERKDEEHDAEQHDHATHREL